jgi:hypothetical protein
LSGLSRRRPSYRFIAREYVRVGDDGGRITFRFCPECGSTVYYSIDIEPDLVGVPVGAFADPTFPAPTYSVYEARRHAWARVPESVQHLE